MSTGGIVYLSHNGEHQVEYPSLITGLLRLLTAEEAQSLRRHYQDSKHSPADMMLALLDAFPAGEPVIVLLDGFERGRGGEREKLAEYALHEALVTVLTAPAHAVTVIATTRGDANRATEGRASPPASLPEGHRLADLRSGDRTCCR